MTDAERGGLRLTPTQYENHMVDAIKATHDEALAHLTLRRGIVVKAIQEIPEGGDRKHMLAILDVAYDRRVKEIQEHLIKGMEALLS